MLIKKHLLLIIFIAAILVVKIYEYAVACYSDQGIQGKPLSLIIMKSY